VIDRQYETIIDCGYTVRRYHTPDAGGCRLQTTIATPAESAPAPREDAAPWDNHCDKLKALEAQLAAEREQCRTAMVASQAEVDALYARAEKAEAKLQMAQLEIDARKQECQTVTHKRDKIEAEVKALREALEQVALPGVGLANIFEDHPEETIDKYYAAYKYCMRDIERRMTIARAALDGSAKEES
jgi:chromosome segregation ATPase